VQLYNRLFNKSSTSYSLRIRYFHREEHKCVPPRFLTVPSPDCLYLYHANHRRPQPTWYLIGDTELGLSLSTVEWHLTHLKRQLTRSLVPNERADEVLSSPSQEAAEITSNGLHGKKKRWRLADQAQHVVVDAHSLTMQSPYNQAAATRNRL